MVILWDSEFPNLKNDFIDLFLKPINVLFLSASTVALHIQQADKKEEFTIKKLQNYLDMIREGIVSVNHETVVKILNNYILIDWGEPKEKEKAKNEIKEYESILRSWYIVFMHEEKKFNNFLPYVGSCEEKKLSKFSKEYYRDCMN